MRPDDEGFPCPQINPDACSDCGLCCQVCPVCPDTALPDPVQLMPDRHSPPKVLAAWHLDDAIRHQSSSGGVFTALAETVLAHGGVVVGAAFDGGMVVRHVMVEDVASLGRLRGSKYVQSEIGHTLFGDIRCSLERDRPVLFSGTPCQVAGLRHFLRRPYESLFCCDLVCHGVPSPLLLRRYAEHNAAIGMPLAKLGFRDKATGWKQFSVRQHFPGGRTRLRSIQADPYMAAFLRGYALREVCYRCVFASHLRWGDITIGDYWGVQRQYPEYDTDDKGTSLLLVNTVKGSQWLEETRGALFLGAADIGSAVLGNPQLSQPSSRPQERNAFYRDLQSTTFRTLARRYRLRKPLLFERVLRSLRRRICTGLRKLK
jgi:coenzyme F420-reducing hydrogenase beta subunit